jgi:hypothetical protein
MSRELRICSVIKEASNSLGCLCEASALVKLNSCCGMLLDVVPKLLSGTDLPKDLTLADQLQPSKTVGLPRILARSSVVNSMNIR